MIKRMDKGMFETICVLGTCKTAIKCIDMILDRNVKIELFDANEKESPFFIKYAKDHKIAYFHLDKKKIFEHIAGIENRCLIMSVANPFILPQNIVLKENICAINFHHALLPKHPGRNGECWAIYEQDEKAGITWHFIDSKIDTGCIIDQRSIVLDESITALRLFEAQNAMAVECFSEFVDDLFRGSLKGKPQNNSVKYKMHYSYEKPNNGMLDLSWNTSKISSFLRSMDYGPIRSMGYAQIEYQGATYKIVKYKIQENLSQSTGICLEDNIMTIHRQDASIILKIK